jgi:hypothetical protein
MTLTGQEIQAGAVAYMIPAHLNADPSVQFHGPAVGPSGKPSPTPDTGPRPFVCICSSGSDSDWTPLSTQPRTGQGGYQRLKIPAKDVANCSGISQSGDSYLQDGAMKYSGPNQAFISASAKELPFPKGLRPQLNTTSLTSVLTECASQNKRSVLFRRD